MNWKQCVNLCFSFILYLPRYDFSPSDVLPASFCDLHNILDGCSCFNRTTFLSEIKLVDVQCCCIGRSVLELPRNFSSSVKVLIIRNVSIKKFHSDAFDNYHHLEKIVIIDCPELIHVNASSFRHMIHLQKFQITKCPKLQTIDGIFHLDRKFLHLQISNTGLEDVPKIETLRHILKVPIIDMAHNKIQRLNPRIFEKLELYSLVLSYNEIESVGDYVISEAKIALLKLDNNPLIKISDNAFANVSLLKQLDLSHSELDHLPEAGLKNVEKLFLNETHNLKKLPSIFVFTKLEEAHLTYPFHCCLFKHAKVSKEYGESGQYRGNIEELSDKYCQVQSTTTAPTTSTQSSSKKSTWFGTTIQSSTTVFKRLITYFRQDRQKRNVREGSSKIFGIEFENAAWGAMKEESEGVDSEDFDPLTTTSFDDDGWGVWGEIIYDKVPNDKVARDMEVPRPTGHGHWLPEARPTFGSKPVVTFCNSSGFVEVQNFYSKIKCYPEPNALNPCEDVMGFPWLRAFIWVIWICSICGNLMVIVVLCATQQSRMRVNHFLIINLAFADLCIGVYLAMLAIQDIKTAGVYYNYAVDWQTGAGCKSAGFLSVFASELSIITMVLISFEVWYNTKYIFYGSRFQLSAAIVAMCFGYLASFIAGVIPLTGYVNSYSATSTCLPLELNSSVDKLYLIIVLGINILGFAYIVFNYVSVYCMVAGKSTPTAHTQDMAIAKRMGILIVTDFICWAPTIFFGVTAAANMPLISISVAKIFLVIFYPINAFANPFLYVFLTKMFRKDMSRLARKHTWLKKLEQSVRRKKSSLLTFQTLSSWASKKHSALSTPRGSNNSAKLQFEVRFENGTEPCLKIVTPENGSMSTFYIPSTDDIQNDFDCNSKNITINGNVNGNNNKSLISLIMRRRHTRRFFPKMSDILENSNSNSAEDEQHMMHSPKSPYLAPLIPHDPSPEVHCSTYWYNALPSPTTPTVTLPTVTTVDVESSVEEPRRSCDSSSSYTWSTTHSDGSSGCASTVTSKISSDSQKSDSSVGSDDVGRRSTIMTGSDRSLESGYITSALPTPETTTNSHTDSVFLYDKVNRQLLQESIL